MEIKYELTDEDIISVAYELASDSDYLQSTFLDKFLENIEDSCGTKFHYNNQLEAIAYSLNPETVEIMRSLVDRRDDMEKESKDE